jgi:hypothetical protein
MAKITKNLVELIGIADSLPENPMYFKEVALPETLVIPSQKPDIEQLLSVMVDPEVISVRLVDTAKAISDEGQNLSGCKLVVELRLREKVKYVADEPTQSVHVAEFLTQLKSVFIVVPCEINGNQVCELIRRNRVNVTPYVEDIFAQMRDKRTVFKNITLLLDVTFRLPG